MRRRAMAVVATRGISPVMAMLVALVIALILLLADPVKAQETTAEETTAEETTVLAADAADMKVEAETDNTSVKVDNGKVSVSTDNDSSDDGTSQQSSVTVQQNQATDGTGSRASTGDVNIGATRRNNSNARVVVDVLDDGVRTGDSITANGGNDVTETIQDGRGFFSLDITADNASYNIRVEDCDPNCNNPEFVRTFTGRDDQRTDEFRIFGNSFRLRIETERVDGDRNRRRHHDRDRNRRRHHDRDRDRNRFFGRGDFRHGAADQQYRSERIVEERVIKETIPNKGRLAATGGVPLTGAAFLALASVGLGVSILRFAIRRDP